MHTRGVSKKIMKERETEEEIEVVTDSEIEQQTDNTKETEVIMDTERETVEEDAQRDQIDLSLIHISLQTVLQVKV